MLAVLVLSVTALYRIEEPSGIVADPILEDDFDVLDIRYGGI
jgi:hypothetical protein